MALSWVSATGTLAQESRPLFLTNAAFGPVGQHLCTTGDRLRVFTNSSETPQWSVGGGLTRVATFLPREDATIFAGGDDGLVRQYEIGRAEAVREFPGPVGEVSEIECSPDARFLATLSYRREKKEAGIAARWELRVWDLKSGNTVHTVENSAGIRGVGFSSDGTLLASGTAPTSAGGPWTIDVRRVPTGELVASVPLSTGSLKSMPFPQTLRRIPGRSEWIVGGGTCIPLPKEDCYPYENCCRMTGLAWKVALGNPEARLILEPRLGYVSSLDISPDGKRYAINGGEVRPREYARVEVWEIERGVRIWSHLNDTRNLFDYRGVRFTPDGSHVIYLTGAEIHFLDADTGAMVKTLRPAE